MRESRLWILSLASSGLVGLLLVLHFALMHFAPVFYGQTIEQARSFSEMLARGRDALQMVVYILFLAFALYHGLYGLRGILLELPLFRRWERLVSGGLLLLGGLFFAYGAYVTWWTFIS
jgi:succinate dehydrogenase hydrophobic anchor subunit